MVANVTDGSLGDVLGNFKTFTSKRLFEMIANNKQESRREWMIRAFERAGKFNPQTKIINSGKMEIILYCFTRLQLSIKR